MDSIGTRGRRSSVGTRGRRGSAFYKGGAFSKTLYREHAVNGLWNELERKIDDLEGTDLYRIYSCQIDSSTVVFSVFYGDYITFITGIQDIIQIITGQQTFNIKTRKINELYMNLDNAVRTQTVRIQRNIPKYTQELLDTIIDFVFTKTIKVYQDIKNKENATLRPSTDRTGTSSSDSSSLPAEARAPVQKVSQLVATKVLELTGQATTIQKKKVVQPSDLQAQIGILQNVANNIGFTNVDDVLIKHFNDTYKGDKNVYVGSNAIEQLQVYLNNCSRKNCRIINNAVPTQIKTIIERTNSVVCPTSSVCDGMQGFGSCAPPQNKEEYHDMDFSISYPYATDERPEPNMYYGKTTISRDKSFVNVNYGIICDDFKLFNFIDIKIDSPPVVLQANTVFKTLINRIIEIWKTATTVRTIDDLWRILENTEYFLSILKLGSQKAVGDIFQEINSTLYNGGYAYPVQKITQVNTYGLMGDRPSGIRVVKLLLDYVMVDGDNAVNTNAYGGYVGGTTSLIYLPESTETRGGKKITRKRRYKYASKTKNNNRKVNQQTKRRKRRRHKTRRY
jgi:hypothetical protein